MVGWLNGCLVANCTQSAWRPGNCVIVGRIGVSVALIHVRLRASGCLWSDAALLLVPNCHGAERLSLGIGSLRSDLESLSIF